MTVGTMFDKARPNGGRARMRICETSEGHGRGVIIERLDEGGARIASQFVPAEELDDLAAAIKGARLLLLGVPGPHELAARPKEVHGKKAPR
jgi:hypothetical protein